MRAPLRTLWGGVRESSSPGRLPKSERTRRAILDSALEFLWSHPFRELTVKELTAMAGCSRPAFYQYFRSLHDLIESLLSGLEKGILEAAAPWFNCEGNPGPAVRQSLENLVRVCYDSGPILRAVSDASAFDRRLEGTWAKFLGTFDDAVEAGITRDQARGFTPPFAARPVAVALNRLDASLLIQAFGRRPRNNPDDVLEALTRIWISTLYGSSSINGQ